MAKEDKYDSKNCINLRTNFFEPVVICDKKRYENGIRYYSNIDNNITASLGIIHNAMAKQTPYQAGHDHGCSDAKIMFSARYINQPGRGPQFHTQEFMSGYSVGFNACSSESSPVASNVGENSGSDSSPQFSQGFSNGVSDAEKDAKDNKLGSGPVVGVDCDSEVDSRFDNQNYCDGYTKGYMGEANKPTTK